jgi:hypothetical protein
MLFVFETCRAFIRTVPVPQHDPIRPDDLDTRAEDRITDETRYAWLSRPLIAPPPGGRWGGELEDDVRGWRRSAVAWSRLSMA